MMDPIQSWVDPDEMRRVAEALISRPRREEESAGEDPGYGDDWVGFTTRSRDGEDRLAPTPEGESPGPLSRAEKNARSSLENARRIAEESGLLRAGEHSAPDQEVTPRSGGAVCDPRSPFLERLRGYGRWLRQNVEARGFFVITREGEVLLDEVQSPRLLQVSRTLAHASSTANRQAGGLSVGSLHIKLDAESILEVIPLGCRYGPLVLGVVLPRSLSPDHAVVVASTLQLAVPMSMPR